MTPKVVDKEARRKEIYWAAIELFAQKGVARTTIQEIADNCGIGKGTIYEYYSGKGEILYTSFQYMQEEIANYLATEIQADATPVDKLRGYFTGMIKYFQSMPTDFSEILLVFWAEGILENPQAEIKKQYGDLDLRQIYAEYIDTLEIIIREGQHSGNFNPDLNSREVASSLIATLDGIMLQWVMFKNEINLESTLETLLTMVFEGMITNEPGTKN